MKQTSVNFEIGRLDHVAIRVKDLNASSAWYENVLGLKKKQVPEWGDFPLFMLSGKTAVALFPSAAGEQKIKSTIDHFAFHVTPENFEKAKQKYTVLGLDFTFQDHHYFHSIYTQDLDGHTVELTTLVKGKESFYR